MKETQFIERVLNNLFKGYNVKVNNLIKIGKILFKVKEIYIDDSKQDKISIKPSLKRESTYNHNQPKDNNEMLCINADSLHRPTNFKVIKSLLRNNKNNEEIKKMFLNNKK